MGQGWPGISLSIFCSSFLPLPPPCPGNHGLHLSLMVLQEAAGWVDHIHLLEVRPEVEN